MCFLNEITFILKAIKFHFKGPNDEKTLPLLVISYKTWEAKLWERSGHVSYKHICALDTLFIEIRVWYVERKAYLTL